MTANVATGPPRDVGPIGAKYLAECGLKLIRLVIPLRASADDQNSGLDIRLHGEEANPALRREHEAQRRDAV